MSPLGYWGLFSWPGPNGAWEEFQSVSGLAFIDGTTSRRCSWKGGLWLGSFSHPQYSYTEFRTSSQQIEREKIRILWLYCQILNLLKGFNFILDLFYNVWWWNILNLLYDQSTAISPWMCVNGVIWHERIDVGLKIYRQTAIHPHIHT